MGNETFEPDVPQRRTVRGKKSEKPKKPETVPVAKQVPETVKKPEPVAFPEIKAMAPEEYRKIRQAILDSSRQAYEEFSRGFVLKKPIETDEEIPSPPPDVVPNQRNDQAFIPSFQSLENPNFDSYRLSSEEEKKLKEVENNKTYKKIWDEVEKRLPAYVKDKRFMASVAERFFKTRQNGLQTVALENMNLREIPEDKMDLSIRDKVAIALGRAGTPAYKLIFIESNVPGKKFISQLQSIEDYILVNYEWAKTVSPEHLAAASFHEKQHHVPDRLDLYRNILLSVISDERGLKDEDKAMLVALGEMAHDRKTVQDLQRQYQGKGLIMLLDFFLQSLMMLQDPGPSFTIRISALKREIARLSLASK